MGNQHQPLNILKRYQLDLIEQELKNMEVL
jgi:hypothetical protein